MFYSTQNQDTHSLHCFQSGQFHDLWADFPRFCSVWVALTTEYSGGLESRLWCGKASAWFGWCDHLGFCQSRQRIHPKVIGRLPPLSFLTWRSLENHHLFNKRYIFMHGCCSIVMPVFRGVWVKKSWVWSLFQDDESHLLGLQDSHWSFTLPPLSRGHSKQSWICYEGKHIMTTWRAV